MAMLEFPCINCQKPVLRWPSQAKNRKWGFYCNRICIGQYKTKTLVGDLSEKFKGVRRDRKYIMVYCPWHPNTDYRKYIGIHRLIVEARLGRFLESGEIVHHKDGNPTNNHWDNLEVMTQAEHAREHMIERNKKRKSL